MYQAAIAQSRDPAFYAELGVTDTLDGRFDLICLHSFLLMERLEQLGPEGKRLAQAVFDRMFKTMDFTLREIGIGDLGVPKHMAKMMKAFNGRVHVYHTALAEKNPAALELAITRNIFRVEGESIPYGVYPLADYVVRANDKMRSYELNDFLNASIQFPPVLLAKREAA